LLGKWVSQHLAPVKHVAAITDPKQFGRLLRDIDKYPTEITRRALQLLALIALRPGKELVKGRWEEIDLEKRVWKVPVERMKKGNEHWVPLSKQAVLLLTELRTFSGDSPFLFPSASSKDGAMAGETLVKALKEMGYKGRHVPHGFRASFNSIVKEEGVIPLSLAEAVDVQLAHKRPNEDLGYDRSGLLEQRREVLQRWADYCDELRRR
jgi:integrase